MTEECYYCGFPILNEGETCIACLPPQFRKTIGRYNLQIAEAIIEDLAAS
ncbi:MAG: hypothetical protein ACFE8F_04180 [Promethearchaeota archaeon]